jgi:hypothetical protein
MKYKVYKKSVVSGYSIASLLSGADFSAFGARFPAFSTTHSADMVDTCQEKKSILDTAD